MAAPTQDHLRVLDQARQRLVQLTQSLGSLVNSINQNDPLPAWSSLHSQASILSSNLLTISHLLHEHREILSSLVAYPTPSFPGRTEAGMLSQLMRTKLEPGGEEWVARGRRVGRSNQAFGTAGAGAGDDGRVGDKLEEEGGSQSLLTTEELRELWRWAPLEANEEARRRNWGAEYTLEEKEMGLGNVVTGLKRRLVDEDEEESDEEEEDEEGEEGAQQQRRQPGEDGDEMEVVGVHRKPSGSGVEFDISREANHVPSKAMSHAVPLDDVFRFMMTGVRHR